MAQDLAVAVLAHRRGPSDPDGFVAWCRGVARNLAAHRRRSFARRPPAHDVDLDVDHAPWSLIATEDLEGRAMARQEVMARTGALDVDALTLLLDRFVLEETAPEIAARLDVSAASIRMRLARVLAAIRPADAAPERDDALEERWTEFDTAARYDCPPSGN